MSEKYDPDPIIKEYIFPTSFEPAGAKMVEMTWYMPASKKTTFPTAVALDRTELVTTVSSVIPSPLAQLLRILTN